jgi:hypothetical protein
MRKAALGLCLLTSVYGTAATAGDSPRSQEVRDRLLGIEAASAAAKPALGSHASDCVNQSIRCGQTINGSLAPGDCLGSDGQLIDLYQFDGTAGEAVSATLTSQDFPPFVDLLDPNIVSRAFDGEPVTAQVHFTLDFPGLWTLGVTNFNTFLETGNYTLSLACSSSGASCRPDALDLCLDSRRFQVAATWMNQFDGTSGTARAIRSTDSTGFFYFTDPTNYELVVKILEIDGAVKVFYTELTDLQFTISVTDTRDGTTKTYQNTPGDCGAIDENAFTAAVPARRALASRGFCAPGPNTLCLLNRRFAVNVDWMNQFNDTSGLGSPRSLSDQSGLFSFTDPTDVELVMKAVDFGDRTAFFWGALSDFAYDISVTDTLGGTTKTYHNAAGSYCGGLDNNAFPP